MGLLFKNSIKKIFKSFGRFISISVIIMLGTGFYLGLKESTPGMFYTADKYYDDSKLMDYKVTSTYGLTDEDIESLKNLENVKEVIATYSLDTMANGSSIRLHAIENEVNKVKLIDGRMPENNNECVADSNKYQVGDILAFDEPSEYLNINGCEVVGTINSALYIFSSYGISNSGDGKLESFAFIPRKAFNYEYFTESYIIAKGTEETNSYENEYNEKANELYEELILLKPIRESIRYEEIMKEAYDEITKIQNELNEEIAKNQSKLNEAKQELDEGQQTLNKTKEETLNTINKNYNDLINNKETIVNELKNNNIEVNELGTTINILNQTITNLKEQLNLIEPETEEYKNLELQINALETQYNSLIEINTNLTKIEKGIKEIEQEKYNFEIKIQEEQDKLDEGYEEYYSGVNELENAKKDAEEQINKAKQELEEIEKPVWYLLDRNDNTGYQNYKDDAEKVEAISKILPVFFIIIALLMCLNTLSRLIEEERTEIGILQSNGFSKTRIISSYLYYVLTSSIIGILVGIFLGYQVISKLIYGVFTANYYLPEYIVVVNPITLCTIIIFTLFLMIMVTIIACSKELKCKPADLLRPKAPKSGKKIFVERVNFIWNKFSFMSKITTRNLFRYKKRIIMTILGVSGCTALLLTGFGLNDSINIISKIQYQDIIKYDEMITLIDEVETIDEKMENLFNQDNISNYLLINQNTYTYKYDGKEETVYLIVPNNVNELNNYISLKSTETEEEVTLSDDGVTITSQMADQLNVDVGENISIRNSDNELIIMRVDNIIYNYVSHYIYISPNYYEKIFNIEPKYNNILINGNITSDIELEDYNMYLITKTSEIEDTFDDLIKNINELIVLVIVCASLLAFAVLYNLTIINVTERKREIATFKVLGFNSIEIFIFIYRETFVLTIFGSLLGLILGVFLHRFVIYTAQTGSVLFLYNIEWYSYVISVIITVILSLIVQLIINKTIKKIDMIDSLKYVE